MIKKLVSFFTIAFILLNLVACQPSQKDLIQAFDSASTLSHEDEVQFDACLITLGLSEDSKKSRVDNDFIAAYLETHTEEEFFDKFYNIYHKVTSDWFNWDDEPDDSCHSFTDKHPCICENLTATLNAIWDIFPLEKLDLSAKLKQNEGQVGYYTENPDDDPQPYSDETSGEFYSHSGENVRSESRPIVGSVTYYGDYAVLYEDGYTYDEGAYEWRNGEFLDELPSWHHWNRCKVYYKGSQIFTFDDITNESQLLEKLRQLSLQKIGEDIYTITQVTVYADKDDRSGPHHSFLYLERIS